jgi:hypothetical protein
MYILVRAESGKSKNGLAYERVKVRQGKVVVGSCLFNSEWTKCMQIEHLAYLLSLPLTCFNRMKGERESGKQIHAVINYMLFN